ncbi:helix-turn-helix domain-containing protein [Echinicola vietnamensis]|uniref:Putative transcriptional regulator n=1 Tax=Echinicola vietnamensis (strain DSM 17526 / LMG 23754 / KMM 6221) TaxID=926556 RepID=L0G200_ECHVK|nr:helix-turn-helix transcriptional regulator [Echinicola vietnamensis]AGA78890.1 putative transcriptional regulator [Echinicola vietnamensis DSM 17526]
MNDGNPFQDQLLDNHSIGQNLMAFRKLRNLKALEVADHLGMSEGNYTKYERGENKITTEIIKQFSQFVKVNPIHILTIEPGHIIDFFYGLEKRKDMMDKNQIESLILILKELKESNDSLKAMLTDPLVSPLINQS